MAIYTFLILFGELLVLPKDEVDWCTEAQEGYPNVIDSYPNPDTNNNPCYRERTPYLLGMNQFEADFSRRMITAVCLGSLIGYERKAADRPAGVRTMALVCLGSCFFTMTGQHAFSDSPQTWDAARVSAAIPSGVGFLGSALIWKHTVGSEQTNNEKHEVYGLTTAASVWLSASVGIGAGGHMYVVSVYAVILVIFVLRLGPRLYLTDDSSYGVETESDWDTEDEKEPLSRDEQRQMLEMQTAEERDTELLHEYAASTRQRDNLHRNSSKKSFRGPVFHG